MSLKYCCVVMQFVVFRHNLKCVTVISFILSHTLVGLNWKLFY